MWPININYKSHETPGYSSSGLACRRQAYGTLGGPRLVPTTRDSFLFIKACPDYFGGKRIKKTNNYRGARFAPPTAIIIRPFPSIKRQIKKAIHKASVHSLPVLSEKSKFNLWINH